MTFVSPESIDLAMLPSLPLSEKKTFPAIAAIYFCLSKDGEVLYIGKSENIARRWKQHHHYCHLETLNDVKLAWLEVSDCRLLTGIECALIQYFNPPLNSLSAGFGRGCIERTEGVSKVAELRRQANLTQRQLADLVGVTNQRLEI
ncbi:MAG: GIY-YIG nuclease family protein [Crinalium sp.]